jgi:iron complex transport system permease protein
MSSAEELKQFTFWSFGSLQQASLNQIPFIAAFVFIAFILSIFVLKPLNAMVLGENSAKNLGVQIQYLRFSIIGITAILTGTITAFCGPIAFVGLAIPNISRLLFRTQNHRILLSSNVLIGAIFMVNCDSIIQLLEPWFVFPINAFTSILGAPFVIYLILKKIV